MLAARRSRARRRTRRLTFAIVGGLAVTLSSATAANFGGPIGASYADNANHTFYYLTTVTSFRNATEWGRINSLNPTDMTSTVQTSSNPDTDVLVRAINQGVDGPAASTGCITPGVGPGEICNQFRITWNAFYAARNAVGCHEIGHSVALGHSGEAASCMRSPPPSTSNWTAHDKAHVNGRY
jgi:hypothetical protein